MMSYLTSLSAEHRGIEAELERLAASVTSGAMDCECFRQVCHLVAQHYRREEDFLAKLRQHHSALAAKLAAQHDEVLEIAARLHESVAAGQAKDVDSLARRLLAMAQHNMIEEERDAFPLAMRP